MLIVFDKLFHKKAKKQETGKKTEKQNENKKWQPKKEEKTGAQKPGCGFSLFFFEKHGRSKYVFLVNA